MREAMLSAISRWTESDRLRAVGIARATLEDGQPIGPLWLMDRPVGGGLADRALLDAYWMAKAGVRWDPAGLQRAIEATSLDRFRTTAAALVANARPVVVTGRR